MQKNWYILYTRQQLEFKVANALTRKKVENFCPRNRKEKEHFRRLKLVYEPLFPSYVFVYVMESELQKLLTLPNVINIVYWKNNPAVVSEKEMLMMKSFTNNFEKIKAEKTSVQTNCEATLPSSSVLKLEGHLLKIRNSFSKIVLPSLGFTLLAEEHTETPQPTVKVVDQELLLQ